MLQAEHFMQKFLFTIAAFAFVLLSAGCGQRADATAQPSQQAFNAVQFCNDFASASPELKILADKAWKSIQSGSFRTALDCLGKLETNPALNDSQKKSIASLTEQVKKQMAANTASK
jgi:hypothetical protein